jgi:putative ABC transport system ATP-binding protein
MISIENMSFTYRGGEFCLQIPHLTMAAGKTAAIIGSSGTGKTTLMNLIAGVAVPEAGRIVTHGATVSELPDVARRDFRIQNIGFVFQEFEMLDYLSVLDNILLPYRITPAMQIDSTVRDRARALAGTVGIEDKLRRNVRRLSQGERQRVAICRALLPQPALILADEPTGNLDPANSDLVLDLLFGYVRDNGTTFLSVTHDWNTLARFDSVIDMSKICATKETT